MHSVLLSDFFALQSQVKFLLTIAQVTFSGVPYSAEYNGKEGAFLLLGIVLFSLSVSA